MQYHSLFSLVCRSVALIFCCLPTVLAPASAQRSQRGHHAPVFDYTTADRYALQTPAQHSADVQTLAAYLCKPFKTEQEKVRAIYRWITANISYDNEYYGAIVEEAVCNRRISQNEYYFRKAERAYNDTLKVIAKRQFSKPAEKTALLKKLAKVWKERVTDYKKTAKELEASRKAAQQQIKRFHAEGRHIQDPATMLKRRVGVCDGYAQLFHALGKQAGLEAHYVSGSVKLNPHHILYRGGPFGHAWNTVIIRKKPWILDCTWADNGSTTDEHWFLIAPDQAIHSHYASDSAHRHLAKNLSLDDFLNLPPEGDYSRYDALIIDGQRTRVQTDSAMDITLSVPPKTTIGAFQGTFESRYDDYLLSSNNIHITTKTDTVLQRDIVTIRAVFPRAGNYHLAVSYQHRQILSYHVRADSGGARAILSGDTATIKPAIQKPIPVRVVHINDPSVIALSAPKAEQGGKRGIQNRSRAMMTFIINDARLGNTAVGRWEQSLQKFEFRKAVALCDTLVNLYPGEAGAYYLRAMAKAAAGEHQQAIEDFNAADALDKQNPLIWYNRGLSYYRLNLFAEAVREFSRAMEKDDDFSDEGLYWRGMCRVKLQLETKAFRDLWEAHERGNEMAMGAIEKYCAREYRRKIELHGE